MPKNNIIAIVSTIVYLASAAPIPGDQTLQGSQFPHNWGAPIQSVQQKANPGFVGSDSAPQFRQFQPSMHVSAGGAFSANSVPQAQAGLSEDTFGFDPSASAQNFMPFSDQDSSIDVSTLDQGFQERQIPEDFDSSWFDQQAVLDQQPQVGSQFPQPAVNAFEAQAAQPSAMVRSRPPIPESVDSQFPAFTANDFGTQPSSMLRSHHPIQDSTDTPASNHNMDSELISAENGLQTGQQFGSRPPLLTRPSIQDASANDIMAQNEGLGDSSELEFESLMGNAAPKSRFTADLPTPKSTDDLTFDRQTADTEFGATIGAPEVRPPVIAPLNGQEMHLSGSGEGIDGVGDVMDDENQWGTSEPLQGADMGIPAGGGLDDFDQNLAAGIPETDPDFRMAEQGNIASDGFEGLGSELPQQNGQGFDFGDSSSAGAEGLDNLEGFGQGFGESSPQRAGGQDMGLNDLEGFGGADQHFGASDPMVEGSGMGEDFGLGSGESNFDLGGSSMGGLAQSNSAFDTGMGMDDFGASAAGAMDESAGVGGGDFGFGGDGMGDSFGAPQVSGSDMRMAADESFGNQFESMGEQMGAQGEAFGAEAGVAGQSSLSDLIKANEGTIQKIAQENNLPLSAAIINNFAGNTDMISKTVHGNKDEFSAILKDLGFHEAAKGLHTADEREIADTINGLAQSPPNVDPNAVAGTLTKHKDKLGKVIQSTIAQNPQAITAMFGSSPGTPHQ